MKATQELPKCPKCGEEPELYSYFVKGGTAWGVSLMCHCKKLRDTIPLPLQKTRIMRVNRCARRLERQWKEYVKESVNERTEAVVECDDNGSKQCTE